MLGLKAKYFLLSYLHIDMASYDLSLTIATEEMGGRSLCRQGQTGTHTEECGSLGLKREGNLGDGTEKQRL